MRTLVAAAVACSILVSLGQAQSSEASIKKNVNIEAQELSSALKEFAQERKLYIIFDDGDVVNHRTAGATGEMTQDEVLGKLLKDTGLTYRYMDEKTVMVVPVSVAPPVRVKEDTAAEGKEAQKKSSWERFRVADADAVEAVGESSEGTQIKEIVVTAQKREERLQDVPMSIGVVTAADIDRRGLINAEDYLRGMPGVHEVGDSYGQSTVVRGLATQTSSQNYFGGATVATYFGETPTTNSAGLTANSNVDLKVVDVERVELLRGPQGTAFGSSALGGAVRTIPSAPKLDRFEGRVGASFSGTSGEGGDNSMVQAWANLPLTSRLAVRAVGYRFEDSGYYRNVAGSDPDFLGSLVTPPNSAGVPVGVPYGVDAFATDQRKVGGSTTTGGRLTALFQPSDDLKLTFSYLTQKTERNGVDVEMTGSESYESAMLQIAPEQVHRGQEHGFFDSDIDIANATLESNLGWASILATYSYLKGGTTYAIPTTQLGLAWPVSYSGESEHRGHIGEVRLATQLDGPWNFLAGLYLEDLKDRSDTDPAWYGSAVTNFFAPGVTGSMGDYFQGRTLKQKAAFAEAVWKILPQVTLTGGVRAYDYDRAELSATDGPFFGHTDLSRQEADASGTSFRGNVSYKPSGNSLFYGSWSQGFRLGTAQIGLNPTTCDTNSDGLIDGTNITVSSTRIVNSDAVDSYELGGKFTLLDRRLTLSADVFRMDWKDVPVSVDVSLIGGPGSAQGCFPYYTANAGAARSKGVELQANFQATEALRIDIGSSWIKAILTKDVPAIGAFADNRLPGSPRHNASLGLQYGLKVAGYDAYVRADSFYLSNSYSDLLEDDFSEADGYVKVDASVRVMFSKLDLEMFVRNLTNEDARTVRYPAYSYRLRPRTVGIQLAYRF